MAKSSRGMSAQTRKPTGYSVLAEGYATSKHSRFSITIAELLGEVIGVDPTETKLHLERHCCLDELDSGMRDDYQAGRETSAAFKYGGYVVRCFSSGRVVVMADQMKYDNGNVDLPDSMRYSQ